MKTGRSKEHKKNIGEKTKAGRKREEIRATKQRGEKRDTREREKKTSEINRSWDSWNYAHNW
jgi:hypothetical protein